MTSPDPAAVRAAERICNAKLSWPVSDFERDALDVARAYHTAITTFPAPTPAADPAVRADAEWIVRSYEGCCPTNLWEERALRVARAYLALAATPAPASPTEETCSRQNCPVCGGPPTTPASPAAGEWHYSQDANGDCEIWEQIDARKFRLVARCKGETTAKLLANIPARLAALERERDSFKEEVVRLREVIRWNASRPEDDAK